ncbi:MAG: hypothetical protein JNL33_01745 [Betaproteobacteria bacterium]|nr:hypothetical protein [Betaproteobacteria bacterium]
MRRIGPRHLFVLAICAIVTLISQGWIGAETIYSKELAVKRSELHFAILNNTPPEGKTWSEIGARSTNIRIASIFAAEFLRKSIGADVAQAYFLLDSAFLFVALVALYAYLRFWFSPQWAFGGLLGMALLLPLTYFLHYFHPWDRPGLLAWIILLHLVRAFRLLPLLVALPASILIKYDTLVMPALYLIAGLRTERKWSAAVGAVLLGAAGLATYSLLCRYFPNSGPSDPTFSIVGQTIKNAKDALESGLRYPPLLADIPLILLAMAGWRDSDQFLRSCVIFSLVPLAAWSTMSNLQEVRAHTPLFVLLLPAAIHGVRRLLNDATAELTPGAKT